VSGLWSLFIIAVLIRHHSVGRVMSVYLYVSMSMYLTAVWIHFEYMHSLIMSYIAYTSTQSFTHSNVWSIFNIHAIDPLLL